MRIFHQVLDETRSRFTVHLVRRVGDPRHVGEELLRCAHSLDPRLGHTYYLNVHFRSLNLLRKSLLGLSSSLLLFGPCHKFSCAESSASYSLMCSRSIPTMK